MIIKLLSTGLLLSATLVAFAQDAKDILQKSYAKCRSIKNGYYEMDKYIKYMSEKDTSKNAFTCYFKKLKDDSLFTSAFHFKQFSKGKHYGDMIYTGDHLVNTDPYDSTAIIRPKALWFEDIKANYLNHTFCSPFTNWKSSPMPGETDLSDTNHIFKFLGSAIINGIACYHIQMNVISQNDSLEMMKTLRWEQHYWIKKEDLIPIQYSTAYDLVINNDTMYQYEKYVISKYKINRLKDESMFTLSAVPAYYKIKDYVPVKDPEPLPKDTIAPNYKLTSLANEEISLTDLRGKLVLIDFFYKSCYPCMLALPILQALHEKYKDKGLKIIGIDPFDKKENDIEAFLAKRGVTYTVLLGGQNVAKDYRVSGYPTMFLIDRNGKIIYIEDGYNSDFEIELEKIILKNLP